MAIQFQSITPAMRQKAERLAEMVPTLTRGRDKRSGINYVTFPSSDDPERTGHNTNGLGCTCEGFRRRATCTHALAVSLWDRRQESAHIAAAQQRRKENGCCSAVGCIMTATSKLGKCEAHTRVLLALVADL
jgi:hypothetical protein